jgi:hypothetical protein
MQTKLHLLRQRCRRLISIISFTVLSVSPTFAATFYVSPSGKDTNTGTVLAQPLKSIQTAINKAASGDTIVLEDGTYTGTGDVDLTVTNKALTIASQNGPSKTVINCAATSGQQHTGFIFNGSGTSSTASKLQGILIENGYLVNGYLTGDGGAVSCLKTTLSVVNCSFNHNTANGGGAFYNDNQSSVTFSNCAFNGNSDNGAGGVSSNAGGVNLFLSCVFTANNSSDGAITNSYGSLTVTRCTFTGNTTDANGVISSNGTDHISGCNFTSNSASSGTSCIFKYGGQLTVDSSIFSGNKAPANAGAAIYSNSSSTVLVRNSIFSQNSALRGGAIYNDSGSTTTVEDCSFAGNSAANAASGGAIYNLATLYVTDDILWGDSSGGTTGQELTNSGGTVQVTYSDLQSGFVGTGNLKADPLFVAANSGNLHLTATSPCVSAGTAISGITTDLDGTARRAYPTMGAYEAGSIWNPLSVRVSANGNTILLFSSITSEAMLITVTPGGTQTSKTYGPSTGTTAVDLALGADNSAYIVWQDQADAGIAIWKVPLSGANTVFHFKPTTAGWTYQSSTVGADGYLHVLWKSLTGEGLLWNIDPTGKTVSTKLFGPF